MGVEGRRSSYEDQMGDCRSFGSNCHPSSLSRKISIGIMMDSQVHQKPGIQKDNDYTTINNEKLISNVGRSCGDGIKGKEVTGSSISKEVGAAEQVKPSQSTNIFPSQKTPTVETAFQANEASDIPDQNGRQDKLDGKGLAPVKYSVHFSSKQISVLQSIKDNMKKFEGITRQRSGTKDGVTERAGKFTYAPGQGEFGSDKAKLEGNESEADRRTETLRMKLWEILGTTNKLRSKSHNMDEENLLPEQPSDKRDDKVTKPRQSSDTIETDSENPDHTSRRPVTRSLTRKRTPTEVQQKKSKGGPSSADKKKDLEGNVFSFEERSSRKPDVFLGGSSSFMKKGVSRKSKIPPRKIFFSVKDNVEKTQQEAFGSDTLLHTEEISSVHKQKGAVPTQLYDDVRESPELGNQEREFDQPPLGKRTASMKSENSGSANCRESFIEKDVGQQDDFQSPTFGFKTPNIISSLSQTPKKGPVVNGVSSPASAEMGCSLGDLRCFSRPKTSEPASSRSSSQRETPEIEKIKDAITSEVSPLAEEKDLQDYTPDSSSEERESGSSQEGLRSYGRFAEPANIEKENPALHPIKRLRSYEGRKFQDISTVSPNSKGGEENDSIHQTSEQNVENGISRAIALFASELEKLQRKLKSVASKRSSEILLAVSEEIQMQLQDVQSQIQADIGKLMGQSKAKRKRLETSFEDKQKQFRLIHEKFKEAVNLHLQDFRSTLESLEANQIEFKGTLEKQKALHKRLLEQVEEATVDQLDDAQRKIAAINESARKKALHLKRAISLCLR